MFIQFTVVVILISALLFNRNLEEQRGHLPGMII